MLMYRKTSGSATVNDAGHHLFSNGSCSLIVFFQPKRHSSNISQDACVKPVSYGSSQLLVTRQSQSLMNGDGNMMSAANNDYLSGPPSLMQARLVPFSCTVDARKRVEGEIYMLQDRPLLHSNMPV